MIKCISCGKELQQEDDVQKDGNHPHCWQVLYDGIIFKSRGNYGSTEYDPMEGENEYLEVAVCDKCLTEKGALVQRFEMSKPRRRAKYKFVETYDEYKERLKRGEFTGIGRTIKDESFDSVD